MKLFCFGLGYSAVATAEALRREAGPGLEIAGTTRATEKVPGLLARRIGVHAFDGSAPGLKLTADLVSATHMLNSIAPGASGDPALHHHKAELDAAADLQWIGYLSTIGVYGNADGAWIDETAPLSPTSVRGRQRIAAEQAWADYARSRGVPLFILRLAGIYGPGRSGFDKLRDGTARRIVKPGQVFNRIHVDDIGRVVALAARRRLGGTFSLTDDEPAAPDEVVAHAARLIKKRLPRKEPFAKADMTEMARSFYADNKRVSNAAIKSALGIELLYPTYREGLDAVLAAERAGAAQTA